MWYVRILFVLYLVSVANVGVAQVTATLNSDNLFVLHANGEKMSGLEIASPSGGLTLANDPSPFGFILGNTRHKITMASIPDVVVTGDNVLSAGLDPAFSPVEVTMMWGGNGGANPVFLQVGPCEDNCPPLRAQVNEDNQIVLAGFGQKVSDITFNSASSSLTAESPTPFDEASINTAAEVQLASPGSHVVIEGAVTLDVAWSDHVFTRDIEFQYHSTNGDLIGPITIDKRDYANKPPRFPRVDVSVNDDDHVVIKGLSQPITNLTLKSNAGSLIPSDDAGPFSGYGSNTDQEISFLTSETFVLDGEVVLPTKWDWRKPKQLRAEIELVGEVIDQVITVPGGRFPSVPQTGNEPLLITLDEDNNFVITGIGQEIVGIDFKSPTGALRTGEEETVAPFPARLSNTSGAVTLGVLGGVVMDGSFVMDFGPVSPDRLDEIEIEVGYKGRKRPVDNPANEFCTRCDLPAVSVSEEGGLVLDNFPDLVTELTFTSKHGGLQQFDLIPEGLTLLSASETEVSVGSDAGFDSDKMQGLQVLWGASFDSQVFVSFALADGTQFGPLPLASVRAIPEPSGAFSALFASCALYGFRRRTRRR